MKLPIYTQLGYLHNGVGYCFDHEATFKAQFIPEYIYSAGEARALYSPPTVEFKLSDHHKLTTDIINNATHLIVKHPDTRIEIAQGKLCIDNQNILHFYPEKSVTNYHISL